MKFFSFLNANLLCFCISVISFVTLLVEASSDKSMKLKVVKCELAFSENLQEFVLKRLRRAIVCNDLSEVDSILNSQIKEANSDLNNLLNFAIEARNKQAVEILLSHGADANMDSPLLRAAGLGSKNIVKTLLKNGARVDDAGENGINSLLLACANGDDDVIEVLLKYGARTDIANDEGYTALMLAAKDGRSDIIQLLLKKSTPASINLQNNKSYTALMYAALARDPVSVRLLLEKGANLHLTNADGDTALHLTVRTKATPYGSGFLYDDNNPEMTRLRVAIIKELKWRDADILAVNSIGQSASIIAVHQENREILKAMNQKVSKKL